MRLWLIEQSAVTDYGTYDSAVVAAETEDEARKTFPDEAVMEWGSSYWANSLDEVSARYVGEAAEGVVAGVILASFNAG